MKAAVVGEKGAEVRDIPKPEPAPTEILIKVRASSLNRADVGVAAGQHHGRVGGIGARRLCRVCDHRRGPRQSHSRQQHDL